MAARAFGNRYIQRHLKPLPSFSPVLIRMSTRKISTLAVLVSLILVFGIMFNPRSAQAGLPGTTNCPTSPGGICQWTVSLDANNVCTVSSSSPTCTDTATQTSFSSTHSFLIGAVVNASGSVAPAAPTCGTQCISGLYGWQFEIVYDNTSFVPQADPIVGTASDFAAPTVIFGGQTPTGNPNWAGMRSTGAAFGSSIVLPVDSTHQKIRVFLSILAPNPAVHVFPQITATHSVTGNLLANVAFENLKVVTSAQFGVTGVKFVDLSGSTLLNSAGAPAVVKGSNVTETLTDAPPVASFTSTHLPNGDASCAAVTGASCSQFAYS